MPIKTLKSPFNDPATGQPQVWQFDLSVPADSAAYAEAMKAWYPDSLHAKPEPKLGSPELRSQLTRQLAEGVPAIGAGIGDVAGTLAGGAIGGPWGAGAGGALGSAGGGALGANAIGNDPGRAALGYGAASLGGQALSALMKAGGTGLMRSAVNPPEWVSRYFPGTWRTALRENVGLGAARDVVEGPESAGFIEKALGNKTGVTGENAVKSVLLPKAEANVQVALGRVKGTPVDMAAVVAEVRRRLFSGSVGRMPVGRGVAKTQVNEVLDQMLRENPGAFDMKRAHELKRGAQGVAADLYEQLANARKSGAVVDQKAEVKEKVMKEVASVLRETLGREVPGYNAAESRAQALIGLRRALQYREAMPPEGLGTRVGHAVYFDPMGLVPEHARSTMARAMNGPLAAILRGGPTAAMPLFPGQSADTTGTGR